MRRRNVLLGAAAVCGAAALGLVVQSRQAGTRRPVIGFLSNVGEADAVKVRDGLREGLRKEGLVEGDNVRIEWRFADGDNERLPRLTQELLDLGAEVIVTTGATVPPVARQATDRVPIVATGGDLVTLGLAASYARPGGNMTGVSQRAAELNSKIIESLVDIVPGTRRMANMANLSVVGGRPTGDSVLAAAARLGLEVLTLDIQRAADLETAFQQAADWQADILYASNTVPLNVPRELVPKLGLQWRMPTGSTAREWVESGSLLAYSTAGQYLGARAAWYVARILNGANPAELPIEIASVFDLVINRTTLERLGLNVPAHVASQVTEWLA
jgi:putative ABC transport system substrate-binding protein